MADNVTLYNKKKRTNEDKTVTTEHTDPEVTTQVSHSWRYNPDTGKENTPLINQYNQDAARIQQAHGVDPATGQVDGRKFLSDMFPGLETMRQQREQEEALNRRKRKESAWYNGLSVLGDMLTTATGGNVWQRQADRHAKDAHDANIALEREQAAEDNAAAQAVRDTKKAYADAMANLDAAYQKAYGTETTIKTQGNTRVTTTGGGFTETGYNQQQPRLNKEGSGNGKENKETINIHLRRTPYGEQTMQFNIGKTEKAALSNKLTTYVRDAAKKNDEFLQQLVKDGIAEVKGSGRNKEISVKDLTRLLDEGMAYDLNGEFAADIMNIYIDTLEKHYKGDGDKQLSRSQIYEMITGQDIHDADGKIDYYRARDLKQMGLEFGNEAIGIPNRSVYLRGTQAVLPSQGNPNAPLATGPWVQNAIPANTAPWVNGK